MERDSHKLKNHLITNPFVLYGITWIVVMLFYILPWSELLPPLRIELILFLAITSIISFLIGLPFYFRNYFVFQHIDVDDTKVRNVKYALIVLYLLLTVECIVQKNVPLISYLFLDADQSAYKDFGLPFLHVIIVNGFGYLFLLTGHLYLSETNKKRIGVLRNVMILCILAGMLVYNRGLVMYSLFGYALMYLMSKRHLFVIILKVTFLFVGILFLFGLMGSYRNAGGMEQGRQFALDIAKATPQFRETGIPAEYLWAYIYVTSPLGNLQNTINQSDPNEIRVRNFPEYLMELLPEMVSKRTGLEVRDGERIAYYLTVGTVYMRSYATFGWSGMIIMFMFTLVFIVVVLLLIPRSSNYFISSVIVVCLIVFFNLFDNMFSFMGLAPQLAFPITLNSISVIQEYFKDNS